MSPTAVLAILCMVTAQATASILVKDDFLYYETDWPNNYEASSARCARTGATLVGNLTAFMTPSGSLDVAPCFVSYSCWIDTYEKDGRFYLTQTHEEIDHKLWRAGEPWIGRDFGVEVSGRRSGSWGLTTISKYEFHAPFCVNDLNNKHSVQALDREYRSIGYSDFADRIKEVLDRLRREKPELFEPDE